MIRRKKINFEGMLRDQSGIKFETDLITFQLQKRSYFIPSLEKKCHSPKGNHNKTVFCKKSCFQIVKLVVSNFQKNCSLCIKLPENLNFE
jgi:hypothetical protein